MRVAKWDRGADLGEDKGLRKYKLVVTKESQGCEIQSGEYNK